jgi:uncharacterized SAM-binding protein YcdF (DUF218 family)
MEWLLGKTLAALVMPLGIVLVVLLVAFALTWRRPPVARGLLLIALAALYALSTHFVAGGLLGLLEPEPRDAAADRSAQAIVVLGGGTYVAAPEYGGDTVNPLTLVRVRYAAHLYRALKKPVLVSGGSHRGSPTPEARAMKQVLEKELQTPVQWVEENSSTTLENARATSALLHAAGIKHIYLVTHAWHMPRAKLAFEAAGFSLIPAPTGYASRRSELTLLDFLPDARAVLNSTLFFHEAIGLGWYHLRIALGR